MKNILSLVLALVMVLGLTACDTSPDGKRIEITKENWQEYFEVKLIPSLSYDAANQPKNGLAQYYICIKDAYREKLISAEVSFDWYTDGYGYCLFTYDMTTGELSQSDFQSADTGLARQDAHGTERLSYPEKQEECAVKILCSTGRIEDTFVSDGARASWRGIAWSTVEITNALGTIVISAD